MTTVHELRQNGYQVSIRHVREFIGVKRADSDEFMTRGEYDEAYMVDNIVFTDPYAKEFYMNQFGFRFHKRMPFYCEAVSATGGWTEVTITRPNGTTTKGKYNFNGRQFNRRIGLVAAIGKAMVFRTENKRYKETILPLETVAT